MNKNGGKTRRALTIFVIAAIVCCLAAASSCKGGSGKSGENEGVYQNGKAILKIGTVFSDDSELTDVLGEPADRQEAASCLGAGTDITFTYDGYSFTAYPHGGAESGQHRVGLIKINRGQYSISSGISVGDDISDVDLSGFELVVNAYFAWYDACSVALSVDNGTVARIVISEGTQED
jgi:hypothetical protein